MSNIRDATFAAACAALPASWLLAKTAGLTIRLDALLDVVGFACVIVLALMRWPEWPLPLQRLIAGIEGILLLSAVTFSGAIASYGVAALTSGYNDALLSSADRFLGFDWLALYTVFEAHPLFAWFGQLAYRAIFAIPSVAIIILAGTGNTPHIYRLVASTGLALLATVLVSAFFMAKSPFIYYLGGHAGFVPITGTVYADTIEALRSSRLTNITSDNLVGLLTFPSFHAACALIFAWGTWPLKRMRPIFLPILGLMLVATPIEGSHYLVDVIAGLAVAVAAILCVRSVETSFERSRADAVGRAPAASSSSATTPTSLALPTRG